MGVMAIGVYLAIQDRKEHKVLYSTVVWISASVVLNSFS